MQWISDNWLLVVLLGGVAVFFLMRGRGGGHGSGHGGGLFGGHGGGHGHGNRRRHDHGDRDEDTAAVPEDRAAPARGETPRQPAANKPRRKGC